MDLLQRRPIGQLSIDTQTLAQRLELASIGDTITYAELSGLIGRNVQGAARGCLLTARRRVLKRHSIVFGVLLNEGLKRLDNAEIVNTGKPALEHAGRHSRRSQRVLLAADYEKLPRESQTQRNAYLTSLKVQELLSTEKAVKRLSQAATIEKKPLSLKGTLEMFSRKSEQE
jgi:hypothetical protein